jgi:4'-phosphopantetheinyl transferase
MADLGRGLHPGFESSISPDEAERAERFRFEADRRRHIISGYAVREVLSRYLKVAPRDVPIATAVKGKPCLKGGGTYFSVSHTKAVAVVAVALARVGVDVEEMDAGFPHAEVAERFFSEGEAHAVRAEADPQRRAAIFFSYWTRKEALLKASGEGLHADPKCVDFSVTQKGEGSWMDHGGVRWAVAELEPERGVFCSLALEGGLRRVERYAWEPPGQ